MKKIFFIFIIFNINVAAAECLQKIERFGTSQLCPNTEVLFLNSSGDYNIGKILYLIPTDIIRITYKVPGPGHFDMEVDRRIHQVSGSNECVANICQNSSVWIKTTSGVTVQGKILKAFNEGTYLISFRLNNNLYAVYRDISQIKIY